MLPLKDIVRAAGRAESQPRQQRWTQGCVCMHLLTCISTKAKPKIKEGRNFPWHLSLEVPPIPTFTFPSQMIPVNLSPSFLYFVIQATYLLWVSSIYSHSGSDCCLIHEAVHNHMTFKHVIEGEIDGYFECNKN